MTEHIRPRTRADDFEQWIGPLEVTSMNRPDTAWRYTDVNGHLHQWFADGKPAISYSPMKRYTLPTLVRITDVEPTDEHPGQYHYECIECRQLIAEQGVNPGSK